MIKQACVVTLLSLCAWAAHAEVVNVDNAEMARLVASGAAVIDIRTAPEWKETGVVAGSKLLTFFDEKGQVDAPAWLQQLKTTIKPGQSVVLICRSREKLDKAFGVMVGKIGKSEMLRRRAEASAARIMALKMHYLG